MRTTTLLRRAAAIGAAAAIAGTALLAMPAGAQTDPWAEARAQLERVQADLRAAMERAQTEAAAAAAQAQAQAAARAADAQAAAQARAAELQDAAAKLHELQRAGRAFEERMGWAGPCVERKEYARLLPQSSRVYRTNDTLVGELTLHKGLCEPTPVQLASYVKLGGGTFGTTPQRLYSRDVVTVQAAGTYRLEVPLATPTEDSPPGLDLDAILELFGQLTPEQQGAILDLVCAFQGDLFVSDATVADPGGTSPNPAGPTAQNILAAVQVDIATPQTVGLFADDGDGLLPEEISNLLAVACGPEVLAETEDPAGDTEVAGAVQTAGLTGELPATGPAETKPLAVVGAVALGLGWLLLAFVAGVRAREAAGV